MEREKKISGRRNHLICKWINNWNAKDNNDKYVASMMYLFIFDTLIDLLPPYPSCFKVSLSWAAVESLKSVGLAWQIVSRIFATRILFR